MAGLVSLNVETNKLNKIVILKLFRGKKSEFNAATLKGLTDNRK